MSHKPWCFTVSVAMAVLPGTVLAGAFIFADGNDPDRIAHPSNYLGNGGTVQVQVCIDPASESATEMQIPIQNAIATWNARQAVSPNLFFGANNDIPSGAIDFESVLIHELGHCIGLAHPNEATESGLSGDDRNYTKTDPGLNGVRDLNPGTDGIRGSSDDLRGDDINLHWFNTGVNNPFVASPPFDMGNYSRDLLDLPVGHTFAANADRTVGNALGFPDTEAVMQQGSFFDEDQRQLQVDDVATLGIGMSGVDETAGTADDYVPELVFGGVQSGCDITVNMSGSSFAFCSINSGQFINGNPNHIRITTANAQFGSTGSFNWYFNQVPSGNDLIFADGFEP